MKKLSVKQRKQGNKAVQNFVLFNDFMNRKTSQKYFVKNNENGKVKEFLKLQDAIDFQEKLVFFYGIDAEVL